MNNEYFLSINDVSTRLDLPAHTLRYWEKQFPVAIKPTTGAGGRRYYRAETVSALETIKDLLYNRGMTIAGVKKLLKEGKFPDNAEFIDGVDKKEKSVVQKKVVKTEVGLFSSTSDIENVIDLLERAKKELK